MSTSHIARYIGKFANFVLAVIVIHNPSSRFVSAEIGKGLLEYHFERAPQLTKVPLLFIVNTEAQKEQPSNDDNKKSWYVQTPVEVAVAFDLEAQCSSRQQLYKIQACDVSNEEQVQAMFEWIIQAI